MLDILLSDDKIYNVEIAYWKNKLQGLSPLLLTTDFNRTSATENKHSSIKFTIDKGITEQLSAVAKSGDAAVFDVLLAAFNVLLYRYSSQEDICVGNTITGDTEILLALRNEITGEDMFMDLLKRVKN